MKKGMLLLLLVACLCCRAQTSHVFFDHINTKNGLPEGYVRSIVEDKEGYIWMATQNWLVKYDGYQYKIYNLGDKSLNKLAITNVASIFKGKDGALWVSTSIKGLFLYNRATDTFQQFVYPQTKPNSDFSIKTIDRDGNVWGRYFDFKARIAKFDIKTKQFEFFSRDEKGPDYINASILNSVQTALDGSIWITSNNGIYRYTGPGIPLKGYFTTTDTAKQIGINPLYEAPSEPGVLWMNTFHGNNINLKIVRFDTKTNTIKVFRQSAKPDSVNSDSMNAIYEDKKKQLWFATNSGLSKLDRNTWKFTNYIPKDTLKAAEKNQLFDFTETTGGDFWISSYSGLIYFNPATGLFKRYLPDGNDPGAISGAEVSAKLIDHTGNFWVGSIRAGANRLNKIKSAFQILKRNPGKDGGLPANFISVLATGNKHNLILTKNAVYNWETESNKFSKLYTAEPGQQFIHGIKGKDSILYIGSNKGLIAYNTLTNEKNTYKFYTKDTAESHNNYVMLVFQDHTGLVWMSKGMDKGISSLDPKTKKITNYAYNENFSIPTVKDNGALDNGKVLSIYEDRANTIWVGTNLGSVNKFDRSTGKFHSYYNEQNKQLYCINALYEDHAGRFWAGTYLTGLFEFDREKGAYVKHFDGQSGLLFNSIDAINEDSKGRLWISSPVGISRIENNATKIKNFSFGTLLPGYDMLGIDRLTLNDGRFVLKLNDALAIFDPTDLDDNPYPPIVHLESIATGDPGGDGKTATGFLTYGRKTIQFPYNQNRVQFNYIALHYDEPLQNIYAYKLDGYDKQWVQAGTTRNVTYNNLSPGKYIFHIKAANSSGVWSSREDSIEIVIKSPWWSAWWAWLLYEIVLISAVYLFINYRSRKLLDDNRDLENKIQARTEEVLQQKEEIEAQRDNLEQTLNELKTTQAQLIQSEKMASLGELTAGIAHEIQNPLNFVNNFSEINQEMIDELEDELKLGNVDEALSITADIKLNEEKINHHGKRADAIVKGMLQHSRNSGGQKEPTDINALADEYLRLSYHGLRAKDKSFNAMIKTEFDESIEEIKVNAQEIGRVILNLLTNAFYAVNEKKKAQPQGYEPVVNIRTKKATLTSGAAGVEIIVTDNGMGIPQKILDKIYQPFFTTKPTGQGTGLGLSMSYDIAKAHGGDLKVETKEGEFTAFILLLPA